MITIDQLTYWLEEVERLEDRSKKIMRQALTEEAGRRQSMEAEWSVFLNKIVALAQTSKDDLETHQQTILEKFREDATFIETLNALLKPCPVGEEYGLLYQLKFNKMQLVIAGAINFIENNLLNLIEGDGQSLGNFNFRSKENEITVLGDDAKGIYGEDRVHGNSRASFLSAGLIHTFLQLKQMKTLADIPAFNELQRGQNHSWVHTSSIAHIVPMPATIKLETHSSYLYSDNLIPQGLAFIHSGYAFGGQRGEKQSVAGNQFGPQDCSSWVTRITNCRTTLTTLDLYNYHQQVTEPSYSVVDTWEASDTAREVASIYEPLKLRDPQKEIKPGQIWNARFFKVEDGKRMPAGGHTGLILGASSNGEVAVLSYARDMPHTEGFGVKLFPARDITTPDSETKVQIFNLRA